MTITFKSVRPSCRSLSRGTKLLVLGAWLVAGLQAGWAQAEGPEIVTQAPVPEPAAAALPGPALDLFFQLGLTDTRDAKWVHVEGQGIEGLSGDRYNQDDEGNAWLLKEDADGTVTLLVNQSRVVKTHKAKEMRRRWTDVEIKPADLGKDIKAITARVKAKGRQPKEESWGDKDETVKRPAELLLFAAHLQRRENTDAVKELLPAIFKLGGSANEILEAAISGVANGKLSSLADTWVRGGDRGAYAQAVDVLVSEFPRGWSNREAAQRLAARLRAEAPVLSDRVKGIADLLLGLNGEQLRLLPQGKNWLLPVVKTVGGDEEDNGEDEDEDEEEEEGEKKAAASAAATDSTRQAIQEFFAQPREAAKVLVALSGDQRFLRTLRMDEGRSFSFDDEEKNVDRQYAELPRPMELGALVRRLLSMVSGEEDEEKDPEFLQVWLKHIEAMSDEELAWNYLRTCGSSRSSTFVSAIRYLIEKGNPATLTKLEAVFSDPAVWGGNMEEIFTHAGNYLRRYEGDRAVFRDKIKAAVSGALEEQQRGRSQFSSTQTSEREKKRMEEWEKAQLAQTAMMLKRVDQLFAPAKAENLMDEFLAAEGMELRMAARNFFTAMAKLPRGEAEAAIFPAVAKAKTPEKKGMLLFVLLRDDAGANRAGDGKFGPQNANPAAREAMAALLADQSIVSPMPIMASKWTVAELTARAIVWPRLSAAQQKQWSQFHLAAPSLASLWMENEVKAVMEGRAFRLPPDPERVPPATRDAVLAELGALPPEKIRPALEAKSPDEQMAVITHLAKPDTVWPPAVLAAHLTVTRVYENESKLGVERWKGRKLDQNLFRELRETFEKETREGRPTGGKFYVIAPLDGVLLSVYPATGTISKEMLENGGITFPPGQPDPLAMISTDVHLSNDKGSTVCFPLWKDAAMTKDWREKAQQAPPPPEEGPTVRGRSRKRVTHPAAVDRALQIITEAGPEARGQFSISWRIETFKALQDSEPFDR